MNWFECKVKYEKSGEYKAVTELYLVDAMSFTEAEARIIEEILPYSTGQVEVCAVKRARISEMFRDDESGDKWYNAKVEFVTIDERKGTEKRTACNMLVLAGSMRDALDNLDAGMKGSLGDYDVVGMVETKIMNVYDADYSRTLADKAAEAAAKEAQAAKEA